MYFVVDVETTGLGGSAQRITEIAAVLFDGREVVEEFYSLVNPQSAISQFATGLTGIDADMVRDAPVFEEIACKIEELSENCVFVAHNVSFDYNVIRAEFKRLGKNYSRKKLCTVKLSRKIYPGLRSYSLGKLCTYLNIDLINRHRAKGDTDATVILLGRLLENDHNGEIARLLNPRYGEGSLPGLLSRSILDKLPETHGIYFFKNANGEIIYVGKAKNIKKRVLSHLYDRTAREVELCRETSDIDFEETGSELLALLNESAAIKHHYPKYNRAQKRTNKGFGILTYTNRKGIVQLGYNKLTMVTNPVAVFYNVNECILFLESLCMEYNLCPKYTQLQTGTDTCNHYKINSCNGICKGEEPVEEYNARVQQAIEAVSLQKETFVIIEQGRVLNEKAIVLVEQGKYCGFGFISESEQIAHFEDFRNHIQPRHNNSDVMQILRQYLNNRSEINIVKPS